MSDETKIITALQLHYTSSRYGYSGSRGYNIRALTESINEEERRILAKMGSYVSPRDLPDTPSQEQIDELFPKAYRSKFLNSGKFSVSYSFYVGLDYSNRFGNYFSHSLLIEHLPDNTWPVDIYNWEGWVRKFEVDKEHDQPSFTLPAVNIHLPKEQEGFGLSVLQEFLQETNKSLYLSRMIRAVLLRKKSSRSLVIREETETDGLFWIACIQKAFPATHQKELSCSSYQFDPKSCSAVNVTLGQTNFTLDETEREYQFYVFDFINDEYSQMDEASNDYAEIIASWMLTKPEILSNFHKFSYYFKHEYLNDELLWMLRLFQLSLGGNITFNKDELIHILNFSNAYTKSKNIEKILSIVSKITTNLSDTDDYSVIIILTSFFIKAAKQTQDSEYYTLTHNLLMRLYYSYWFNNNHAIKSDILNLRAEAHESELFDQEFAVFFLSEETQSELIKNYTHQKPEILSEIIDVYIAAINKIENSSYFENSQFKSFIKVVLVDTETNLTTLDWLFNSFIDDNEAIVELILFVNFLTKNNASKQKNFNIYFTNFLATHGEGEEFRFSIINKLKLNNSSWKILENEWQLRIDKQKNKINAHQLYQQNVLSGQDDFTKNYFIKLSQNLWHILNRQEQQLLAISWMKDGTVTIFPDEFIKTIVQTASNLIEFNPADKNSESIIEILEPLLTDKKFQLRPNRIFLRKEILKLKNDDFIFNNLNISELTKAFEGILQKEYADFILIYLPLILIKVTNKKQHGNIIQNTYIKAYLDDFLKAYRLFFNDRDKNKFNLSDEACLYFWLTLEKDDERYDFPPPLLKHAISFLVKRISKMKNKPYTTLLNKMTSDSSLSKESRENWDKLKSQIEEKRKKWWNKKIF